jgi:6-pyruvoyltetrahydropterin/6-carboxytetrahydropterin synthase
MTYRTRMFTLGVSDHVMIAHSFADPFFGPAQRLHGATYAIDLEVRAPALGPHHVVMDIGALRALLRSVLADLDYRSLDDHPAFPGRTSTTERVAEYVADRVVGEIGRLAVDAAPARGASVRVIVRESPLAYAAYERAV